MFVAAYYGFLAAAIPVTAVIVVWRNWDYDVLVYWLGMLSGVAYPAAVILLITGLWITSPLTFIALMLAYCGPALLGGLTITLKTQGACRRPCSWQ
jgi:hypothetical protein